jgi:hypothetical protein
VLSLNVICVVDLVKVMDMGGDLVVGGFTRSKLVNYIVVYIM